MQLDQVTFWVRVQIVKRIRKNKLRSSGKISVNWCLSHFYMMVVRYSEHFELLFPNCELQITKRPDPMQKQSL